MSNEVEFLYRSVLVNTKFQLLYVYTAPEDGKRDDQYHERLQA
ncbi:hypothetical protein [Nostoc commune]|nr:hypothetical protein [Nostoc commune]